MFLNHIKIKITILLWYCSKAWSRNFELLTRPLRLSLWFNSLQLSSKKKVIHRQTFSFSITKNMVDFRICYVMLCYYVSVLFILQTCLFDLTTTVRALFFMKNQFFYRFNFLFHNLHVFTRNYILCILVVVGIDCSIWCSPVYVSMF